MVLCDADMNPLTILPLHGGREGDNHGFDSLSYANPFIGQVENTENEAIVSLFMPKEGNVNEEVGELIYKVKFDKPQ